MTTSMPLKIQTALHKKSANLVERALSLRERVSRSDG